MRFDQREDDYGFVLSDGRIIDNEDAAERLKILCRLRPEGKQEDRNNYSWNEFGMAEIFSDLFEGEIMYCVEDKKWYMYDQKAGVWVGDLLPPRSLLAYFLDIMRIYATNRIDSMEIRDSYTKMIDKMYDVRSRDRIAKDLEGMMRVSKKDFDAKPNLINFQNCTFDMKTGREHRHTYKDYLTMKCNAVYNKNIRCERFEQFVREVCNDDKDKIDFLKRALGYSLLGDAREECMFILYGKTTRNGKSTLLDAVNYVMGDYGKVAQVSIICKQGSKVSSGSANSELAALKGKRFVTMSESDQYGKLDAEMIKTMTGGEEMSVRDLYEKTSSFRPQFKMWLSCNDLPGVTDKSLFASERIKLISFDRHFAEAERDVTLKSFFREPDSCSGILNWLIEGWKAYKKVGLKLPESMRELIKQYEDDNDIVYQFLTRCCKQEGFTKRKELYSYYKMWCAENGYYSSSSKKFYDAVSGHGYNIVARDGIRGFKNITYVGET